ncbi:MAG TPA: DEAD/DEAH box helicase [Actinomycetota bacterium]|nr:DEAD/DEAH box helicase [Actinomycetota bacterium]
MSMSAVQPGAPVGALDPRSFTELGVSPGVAEALGIDGIVTPFPIQSRVIPDALAGSDVLARSRTGSGKTLAFAVPIVERLRPGRRPHALVVVPTRELASQVADGFRAIVGASGLTVAPVYGGVSIPAQAKKARTADIVVATPGRLLDLVARRLLRLDQVGIVVLDEADRLLDMGFVPDVRKILALLRPERQTMLFSATLDGDVGDLAREVTRHPTVHEVGDGRLTVTDVAHRFVAVAHPDKHPRLIRELAAERDLALVFVRTQRGADRLARALRKAGFGAGELHGGMSQGQRERALARFVSRHRDVLVATDVAARGLDVDGISHVINYDAPADHTTYVHRVGRTGRAGRRGDAVTFVTPDQHTDIGKIAKRLALTTGLGHTRPAPAARRRAEPRRRRPTR